MLCALAPWGLGVAVAQEPGAAASVDGTADPSAVAQEVTDPTQGLRLWTGAPYPVVPRSADGAIVLDLPLRSGSLGGPEFRAHPVAVVFGEGEGAEAIDDTAITVAAGEPSDSDGVSTVRLTFDRSRFSRPGTYHLHLLARWPGDPPRQQTLDVPVTVPQGALELPDSVVVERVRGCVDVWPLGTWQVGVCQYPQSLSLVETSRRGALFPLRATQVSGSLRGPDNTPVAGRLDLTLPDAFLAADGREPATLAVDGRLPLGTTVGSLRLSAPQLAEAHDLEVQIVQRVSRLWLLGILGAAIGVGYLVRVRLLGGIERDKTLLAALSERQQLLDLADKEPDPDVARDIRRQAEKLSSAIEARHWAGLNALVEEVRQAVEALQEEAQTAGNEALRSLKALREWIWSPEAYPPELRTDLEEVLRTVGTLEEDLQTGAVRKPAQETRELLDALEPRLHPRVVQARRTVEGVLETLQPWPDTDFGEALETFRKTPPVPDPGASVEELLGHARAFTHAAEDIVFGLAPRRMVSVKQKVADTLGSLLDNAESNALDDASKAVEALRDPQPDSEADPWRAAESAFTQLWQALASALRHADGANDSSDPDLEARIRDGKFLEAAQLVAARASAGEESESADPSGFSLGTSRGVDGAEVEAAADGVDSSQARPRFRSSIDSKRVGAERRAVESFDPKQLSLDIQRKERFVTLVSGVFIAGAGYLIFQKAFLGTFEDFFAAALWGFTADLGIARVREIAAPLAGLKPNLPSGLSSNSEKGA